MDDALFYKGLAALDQGMADRWKAQTGGKLSAKINDDQLVEIVKPIFQTGKITAQQAKALDYFYIWTQANFTKDAWALFYVAVEQAYMMDYFFAGSAAQLVNDTQLREVYEAIGAASGQVDFTSPKTGLTYSPDQYGAVKKLIADGKITVFEVDAAWLHAQGGLYRSDIDRLVLYKGPTPMARRWMIIHELTHAIQDWLDVVTIHKYIEADAYIAQAVAALSVSEDAYKLIEEFKSQKDAAQLVLDKKAVPKNKEWEKAYAGVVKGVEGSPLYAQTKNLPFKPMKTEKKKDEKKILRAIMQQMNKTAPLPNPSGQQVNRITK